MQDHEGEGPAMAGRKGATPLRLYLGQLNSTVFLLTLQDTVDPVLYIAISASASTNRVWRSITTTIL